MINFEEELKNFKEEVEIGNNETSLFEIDYNESNNENNHRIWTKRQMKENFIEVQKIPQENASYIRPGNFC